jgi:hypothetical protein
MSARWPVRAGAFGDAALQAIVGGGIVLAAGSTVVPVMLVLGPDAVGLGIAWLTFALGLGAWAAWRVTRGMVRRRAERGPFLTLDGDVLRAPDGRSVRLQPGVSLALGWWSMNSPFPGQPSVEVPAEGVVLRIGEGAEALVLWSDDGTAPGREAGAPRVPSPLGQGISMFGVDIVAVYKAVQGRT